MVLKGIPVTVTVVLVLLSQVEEVYPQRTGDVRLAGYGSTRFAGRVEMFVGRQWMGICNDGFSRLDGHVVCRQLGLGHAAKLVNVDRDHLYKLYLGRGRDNVYNRYGVGPRIIIEGVNCVGDETHLLNCGYTTRHDCQEHEIIGIQCDNHEEQPYSGDVRLTGGEYPSEGRLEVFFNGQWGGVCSSGFDPSDGDVVCRQMGYTNVENITTSNADRFGSNPGRVWLTNVDCPVNNTQREFCLKSCLPSQSAPEGSSSVDCTTGLVGLQCGFKTSLRDPFSTGSKNSCEVEGSVPAEGEVRIVDGPSNSLGRVEVYLNGVWGTVCGILSQFSRASADVMCRQLGYTTWSNVLHRSGVSGYGTGDGPRHITRLNCTGAENSVLECSRENSTISPCGDADVMALNCSTNKLHLTYGTTILEAGSGGHGHLFIRSSSGYSPVCDHMFGMREGDVACRQMGYTRAISVVKNSYYATGIRPASISHIQCHGNETHLLQCPHRNDSNDHCDKFDQIGLQCSTSNDDREGGLRLTGRGASSSAGALEIFLKGRWNRICSILFKQTAADVACRQLGYSGALGFFIDGRYGSTDSGIFSVISCHGSEERLFDCANTPLHPAYCRKDIAVSCSLDPPSEEGRVRLTGGPDNTTGRLEVYEYGRWGSVCSNEFDDNDALVACKQLGYHRSEGFTNSFNKALKKDDIPINIFAIHCNGNELNLTSCEHEVIVKKCNHSHDVVLTCAECTRQCMNGGVLDEECSCNCSSAIDYSGEECEVCSIRCENGGTANREDCTCSCPSGYGGKYCEECTKMCENEGILDPDKCFCNCSAIDYIGDRCEVCSIQCDHGGSQNRDCTCSCVGDYTGTYCEVCSKTCENGALDEDRCACNCSGTNYRGDNCEVCNVVCANGGSPSLECGCNCPADFSGEFCQNCSIADKCQNGTANIDDCSCTCEEDYSGTYCNECSIRCQNGGKTNMTSCTCECAGFYTGSHCEECPLTCGANGALNAGACTCSCSGGFTGPTCTVATLTGVPPEAAAGLSVGLILLALLVVMLFAFMALVYALRKRKKKAEARIESDWIPGMHADGFDINFNNPQYDEDSIQKDDFL